MWRGSDRPLAGKRIAVTRPASSVDELQPLLERAGAEVISAPLTAIVGPEDPEPLRRAADRLEAFDWIVFTSVNGVAHFGAALAATERTIPDSVRICAVGPATARAVEGLGASVDLVPDEYVAEGVAEALLRTSNMSGQRILYPRAEVARTIITDALRDAGAEVVDIVAYRTIPDPAGIAILGGHIAEDDLDVIAFASGSAVRTCVDAFGAELGSAVVASIGPITSAAARARGLQVGIEATTYTGEGLATAIRRWYESGGEVPREA